MSGPGPIQWPQRSLWNQLDRQRRNQPTTVTNKSNTTSPSIEQTQSETTPTHQEGQLQEQNQHDKDTITTKGDVATDTLPEEEDWELFDEEYVYADFKGIIEKDVMNVGNVISFIELDSTKPLIQVW